ncbi:hypothetical protein HK104_009155 [Borealophlyctis nickersoniae]|nr:hypothetical protein HK104_009155 [Borealophlyctis nickersoniae]
MRRLFHLLVLFLLATNALAQWPPAHFNFTVPFKKGGGSASIAETQVKYLPGVNLIYNSANSGADEWGKMKTYPKDGSVITLINLPHIYIQPYVPSLHAQYTPDDIAIAYIHTYTPLVLLVAANSPIRDWYDFVDACKTSHVVVSGAGMGTVFEVGSDRLRKLANLQFDYASAGDGADAAINATVAGNFTAAWTTTPVVIGRTDIRPIAIAAEFEFPQIDAPTFNNLGINYVDGIYRGVGLPKGTRDDVLQQVSDYFNHMNRNLSFIAEVQASGATQVFMPYGSKSLNTFTARYYKQVMSTLFPPDPIERGALYSFFALGGVGVLLTIGAAGFATVYRATPIIKGSSYFFNLIILVGILLAYLSVMVYSVQMPLQGVTEQTLNLVCQGMPWLLGLGFDITFAAIIVKSYRLYRLFMFSAASIIQFNASNLAILKWVAIVCGANVVVYVVWTAYDPLTATLLSLDGNETFYYACQSRSSAFLAVTLVLKYAMLVACIFFSIKLRDLNAMLNESKAIAAATFSTTFISTVCLAVYALVGNFEGRYIILTGGAILGTTCVLGALFVPKIMVVIFSPDSNTFDAVRRVLKGSSLQSRSGGSGSAQDSSMSPKSPTAPLHRGSSVDLFSPAMVAVANTAGSKHPIYIQEGKPIAREQKDRINALTRVISNTAASGRIPEFQEHVTKLANYASRFRVMNAKGGSRAVLLNPGRSMMDTTKQIAEENF